MTSTLRPLTTWLREQSGDVTVHLRDVERVLGRPLPASAWRHAAFWSNSSSYAPAWTDAGYRVSRRGVLADHVRFEQLTRQSSDLVPERPEASDVAHPARATPDLLLLSCAKTKLDRPALAQDLYVSDGFRKRRRFAEAAGVPWFIVSTEHGLLGPEALVEPYDVDLAHQTAAYRRTWGEWVVAKLVRDVGALADLVVEVHASEAYASAIRRPLQQAGARVHEPLRGLAQGQRLAWYLAAAGAGQAATEMPAEDARSDPPARLLTDPGRRHRLADVAPEQVPAEPGLYAWFVDPAGAEDLSRDLGHHVDEGLIYAGQAGATRRRSGKASSNTLRTRLLRMHAAGRARGSTFRLTLAACLGFTTDDGGIDEDALSDWMRAHLSLAWVALSGDDVADAEDRLLEELDPPLNLMGRSGTVLRLALKALRKGLR